MIQKFLPLLLTLFSYSFSYAQCNGSFLKTILFECDEPFDMDNRTTFDAVEGTWSGGAYITADGIFTPTGLAPGDYTITFTTDSPPCNPFANFIVTVAPTPEVALTQHTLEMCENDGLVDLSVYEDESSIPGYWEGIGLINNHTFDPSGLSGEVELSFIAYCDNDEPAICVIPFLPNPVCGCDGNFYNSTCEAELEGIITYTPWIPNFPPTCPPASGCDIDFEIFTITVMPSTDVMLNTSSVSLCDTDIPVNLNDYVAPSSDAGTWDVPSIFDPMLSGVGNYFFNYSSGSDICDDSETLSITVEEGVNIELTQASLSVCSDAGTINLNNFFATGSDIGTWNGNGVNAATSTFDPSAVGFGVQTLTVSTGFDACDDLETFVIVVNESTTAILTNAAITICSDSGLLDLSQYVDLASSAGNWSGTGVNGTNFNPAAGSQALTFSTVPVGPCDDDATLNVLVIPTPNAILNAALVAVCSTDQTVDLNQYVSNSSDDGVWSGTGVSNDSFDPSVGNQTLTFTSINGDCNTSAELNLEVVSPPDAATFPASPAQLCSNSGTGFVQILDLNVMLAGDEGGTWTYSPAVNGFNPIADNNTFNANGLPFNTYTLTYTIDSGEPCGEVSSSQTIEVIECIFNCTANASFNPPPDLCAVEDNELDLNTLVTGDTGGIWTTTAPIGTLSGSSFNPEGLSGNFTITYTVADEIPECPDAVQNAIISIIAPPTATTSAPLDRFCIEENGFDLFNLVVGNSSGVWSSSDAPDAIDEAGFFSFEGIAAGQYVVTYTVVAQDPCVGDAVSSEIITIQDNGNSAGEDAEICGLSTALNAVSSEEGFWTFMIVPTSPLMATFEDANDPQTNVTVNQAGTYAFVWAHLDPFANVCFDEDIVEITFSDLMEVSTDFLCSEDNLTYDLTLSISGGYPPYLIDGVGITGSSHTLTLNNDEVYNLVVDDSGNCDEIEVSGSFTCYCPPPNDPIVEPDYLSYCEGAAIPTFNVLDNGIDTFNWYGSETSIDILATGISFTPSIPGTYWVEAVSPDGCESENRIPAIVQEIPIPDAPTPVSDTEVSFCEDEEIAFIFEAQTSGNNIINWYDVAVGGESILENSPTFSATSQGIYYAESMTLPDSCRSESRTAFEIIVNPLDDSNFTYPSAVYCLNEDNPLPDFVATANGIFSSPDGISIDAETGEIALQELEKGSEYVIEYQTTGICPTVSFFSFQIAEDLIEVEAGEPIQICRGETILLNGEILSGTPVSLEWTSSIEGSFEDSSDFSTVFSPNDVSNNFYLYLSATNQCDDVFVDSMQVLITEISELSVEGNTTLYLGDTTQLVVSGGNNGFVWEAHPDLSCVDCFNPVFTAINLGTTTLTVESEADCVLPLTFDIVVDIVPTIVFPNAFSPNGDGINDVFRPQSSEPLATYSLQIFNRWGERVFESVDINDAWDGTHKGKMSGIGVYVYVLQYQFVGSEAEGLKKGNVTLIF